METASALNFFESALKKLSLRMFFVSPKASPDTPFDLGLRASLGIEEGCYAALSPHLSSAEAFGIYVLTDRFLCSYAFLRVEKEGARYLVIGPYRRKKVTLDDFLLRLGECDQKTLRGAIAYFGALPTVGDSHPLFLLLETLGDHLFGSGEYSFHTVKEKYEMDLSQALSKRRAAAALGGGQERKIELVYAYENEMMQIISHGQAHRLSQFTGLFRLSEGMLERRSADPLRNLKNYGIIFNTLARKAAEGGGVHPLHLDSVSRHFALQIEEAASLGELTPLLEGMLYAYCRLVQKYSLKSYSPPIQKAMAFIDANPAERHRLSELAARLSLSESYLSDLFRRETGMTLTSYINKKRIELACSLLTGTDERIGDIAAGVGILDLQYFSKLFKRITGETPFGYRKIRIATKKIRE